MSTLPSLPEGWSVQVNDCVGVDYLYNGVVKFQHPIDSRAARELIIVTHKILEAP